MTTDTSTTAAVPPPSDTLPAVPSHAVGKTIGKHLDAALAGEPTALTRNGRPVGVLVAAGWYDRQPGAHEGAASPTLREHGRPIPREYVAAHLSDLWQRPDIDDVGDDRRVELVAGEIEVTAALLDELAAVYRGEPLGRLAARVAAELVERRGADL